MLKTALQYIIELSVQASIQSNLGKSGRILNFCPKYTDNQGKTSRIATPGIK
jgi:hypothetical protein